MLIQIPKKPLIKGGWAVGNKLYAISALLKGYLPFENSGFELYSFIGGAYMNLDGLISYNSKQVYSDSSDGIVATVGLGVNYHLNKKITAHLQFDRTGPREGSKDTFAIPASELVSLGLTYNI